MSSIASIEYYLCCGWHNIYIQLCLVEQKCVEFLYSQQQIQLNSMCICSLQCKQSSLLNDAAYYFKLQFSHVTAALRSLYVTIITNLFFGFRFMRFSQLDLHATTRIKQCEMI